MQMNFLEFFGLWQDLACLPQKAGGGDDMNDFSSYREGELILYQNGDCFEIGKIKRLTPTGAFVWYSEGDTASKTPYENLHKIANDYTIIQTTLGGYEGTT